MHFLIFVFAMLFQCFATETACSQSWLFSLCTLLAPLPRLVLCVCLFAALYDADRACSAIRDFIHVKQVGRVERAVPRIVLSV
jgi:hypothetical protein